jgi:two-component system OmpR family response regulator
VTSTVACALHIPSLEQAAVARGLSLVRVEADGLGRSAAHAAVLGLDGQDPASRVAMARAQGWHGALMLVLAEGCGASVACALDAGADDAVALPASAVEIAARLAARVRERAPEIALGSLRIDSAGRQATLGERPLRLLPREFALLLHLARRPGRPASRAELLAALWGLRFDPGTNVVEVQVSRLRSKLVGDRAPVLRTVRGEGYRLDAPA